MQSARFRRSLRCAASIAIAIGVTTLAAEASAAGVPPSAATKEQKDQAQSHFLRGKELYTQNKFDAALAEFTLSLDVVASPNTRLYVARCLREMNRTVQAYNEFGRTSQEARELARSDSRYEKAADAAQQDQKALEPKIGLVSVNVQNANASTTLRVGGEEVRREGWTEPVAVAPGNAEVVAETPGRPAARKSVTVAAGQKESVTVDAAADGAPAPVAAKPEKEEKTVRVTTPSESSGLRPYAYVAGGIALAGLATFTVAGLVSNGTYSDLQQDCGGERACPPGHEDDIKAGKTQQTIANVGLVVFVVGAVGAVTLWVLSAPSKATAATTKTTSTTKVVARGTFLGLEGTF
jgi:hypothetical protein